jgi:rare lipoprotein A
LGIVVALMTCVAACGSPGGRSSSGAGQTGSYKVGAPYKIDGVWYTPQEEFNHTETGVASWYGPGFHGKSTANGERYDQSERTAAHRTLQMPAVVRVTNLENGRSTVVRINDRGPFARSRIIDLSRSAADELDVVRMGTARVRIDQLPTESQAVKEVAMNGGGPPEQMAAAAQVSAGQRTPQPVASPAEAVAYAPPPPPPPPSPQPPPAPVPAAAPAVWTPSSPPPESVPVSSRGGGGASVSSLVAGNALRPVGGFYVQTGAFSTPENAERQRDAISSYGASEISQGSAGGRDIYRVRLGPYTTPDAAGIVADRLKRSGYGDARVIAN